MALNASKSFSGGISKQHHKPKVGKTSTLPRKKGGFPRPSLRQEDSDDENKIGEISVSLYRSVLTDQGSSHNRRALLVRKNDDGSLGFTLQTYGLYNEETGDLEVWTYVDHVALDGPARKAGMRAGDVIIGVNGEPTDDADHRTIVDLIRNSGDNVRMVVLFQDCVRKVELHQKLLRLKKVLEVKQKQLEKLNEREARFIQHRPRLPSESTVLPLPSLRRTKLTSSLPLLPSAQPPQIHKSPSMASAERPLVPQDVRSRHLSGPRALGSEIRLLDPATVASIGGSSIPKSFREPTKPSAAITAPATRSPTPRRSASSVSASTQKSEEIKAPLTPPLKPRQSPTPSKSKGLKRQGAMRGVSPRLKVKAGPRAEVYSSEIEGERGSDSTDDDAFVNLTPKSSPPISPVRPTTLKFGAPTPRSGLIGKDLITKDYTSLGVPKMLTVLSPRSKTPEPRSHPRSPMKARPLTPVVLEPVDVGSQPISDNSSIDSTDSRPISVDSSPKEPIRDRFRIEIQPITDGEDDSDADQEDQLIEMRRRRQPMKRIASTDFTVADPVRMSRMREQSTIDLDLPTITGDDVIDDEPIRDHEKPRETDEPIRDSTDSAIDIDGPISDKSLKENNNDVSKRAELVSESDECTSF